MWTRRRVCLILSNLSLCLSGLHLYAQTTVVPAHVFPLGAWDQRGQFIEEIKSDQIRIKGLAATIRRVELDNAARHIILLLDTSGSMGKYQTASWSNAAQTAVQFVLERQENDLIELDTFSDDHEVVVPFTVDSKSVIRQIEAITNSGRGRTMLGRALTDILTSKANGLRFGDAIILVSDGEYSEADETDLAKLRNKFIRMGVRVCLLRVPPISVFRGVRDASEFITGTGGIELRMSPGAVHAPEQAPRHVDPHIIGHSVRAAYGFVKTFYRVELDVSGPIRRPRKFSLEVLDQQGRNLERVELNYSRYLLPPLAQP